MRLHLSLSNQAKILRIIAVAFLSGVAAAKFGFILQGFVSLDCRISTRIPCRVNMCDSRASQGVSMYETTSDLEVQHPK